MKSLLERADPSLGIARRNDDEPNGRRATSRRRLYVGDGLAVRLNHRGQWLPGEVIDLSPHGLGIALAKDAGEDLEHGDAVIVEYAPRRAPPVELRAVVVHTAEATLVGRPMRRVGLKIERGVPQLRTRERRTSERFPCSENMPVVASAPSPVFFRELLHFRVHEIGAGGLTLTTSTRNKELVCGLALDLRMHLPLIGEIDARGVIGSIEPAAGGSRYRIGLRFRESPPALHAALAEYLLITNRTVTPASLRGSGFVVSASERAITWDYAASPSDYRRILGLRLDAHSHEGRWGDCGAPDMASSFDAHARHLVGRFAGHIVASGRVAFIEGMPARSEYVQAGHVVPDWLWKAGFCESGANVIHPAFQRTNLLVALLRHAVRVTLQAGYRYVLGASTPPLVPVYRKFGCTVLEEREVLPKPSWRFVSTLMVIDVERLVRECGGGVFGPVLEFIDR